MLLGQMTDQQASQQPAAEAREAAVEVQKGPQPKRQLPQLGEERSRVLPECLMSHLTLQPQQEQWQVR
jgi:hypothetical protein